MMKHLNTTAYLIESFFQVTQISGWYCYWPKPYIGAISALEKDYNLLTKLITKVYQIFLNWRHFYELAKGFPTLSSSF